MNPINKFNKEQINGVFEKLKSDYFLRKIFDYMKKNKSLEIMKRNKHIQKRLNLSIKDYKEYYNQLYFSNIEVELKLNDNEYGRFINIPDEVKEYFHIYFDNSKEEIKRNYLIENEKVKVINIIIDCQVKSFKGLFTYCTCIRSITFKKFFRVNITNMSFMFWGCSSLNELNISNFNTNNVTDMRWMFSECSSLKELNVSNINTKNVSDMRCMFSGCSDELKKKLKEQNINIKID